MKFNLPNILIIFRIVLIPVFLFFFLNASPTENIFQMLALLVFIVAAVSDFFDGYLARKWNTVSNFGKLMDPVADKMLVCSAMIALVYARELSAWIVAVIVCREIWVTSLRMLALEQGQEVIAASMWGKVKTVLQIAMIIGLLISFGGFLGIVTQILVYLALIATVISAAEYTIKNRDVFKA